jgi:hypothetical protein
MGPSADKMTTHSERIRYATRRALFFCVLISIAFIGMWLVSPGRPLRPLAPILGPIAAIVAILAAMLAGIYGYIALSGWLLGSGAKEEDI